MQDSPQPDDLPLPISRALAVRTLAAEGETPVSLMPDAAELAALARHLEVESLTAVALTGEIHRQGRKGWRLEARLRGRIGQLCIVTLEPVETIVDVPVTRTFMPGAEAGGTVALTLGEDGAEAEDPPEPLGETIDLAAILVEELALATDPYPRAPGAELGTLTQPPPGVAPIDPEAEKPFAKLAGLRARLGGDPD